MKLSIKLSQGTVGSASMKRLSAALTQRLGYKVWRTQKVQPKKKQLTYGQGVDKIAQYKWFELHEVPALEFTTDPETANSWFKDTECVIGRKFVNSSCGKGIVVYTDVDAFNNSLPCPVYTKYKKKKREFRVHVFQNSVVVIKEKKLRANWDGPREAKIRNLANGYVFCTCTDEPVGLRELALKAAKVVDSDFKGVDIGFNEKKNELFVIEVNSAPGIEGSNVDLYVNTIVNNV